LSLESGWEFLQNFLLICLEQIILLGMYLAEFLVVKKQTKEIEEDLEELVLRTGLTQ